MVSVVASLVLGLALLAAAGFKLAGGPAARAALGTYGLHGRRAHAVWAALVAIEAVLAVGVGAGVDAAAQLAALLMAGAVAVQVTALLAGRGGAPCACFGPKGRLGTRSAGRAALLAGALAVLPLLPRTEPTQTGWLAIGLGLALGGLAALAVVVLALAREVGMLRLAVPQAGALEISHEGPEIGARSALVAAFGPELGAGRLGLAVFTSEGCGLCRVLAPTIERFGAHPLLTLRTFDEVADADAWAA